ncbi:hypothetical protein C5167_029001 [Papaver somniferum]|nr:hypothetical protein C5167_029001 [Papaver somniferum]
MRSSPSSGAPSPSLLWMPIPCPLFRREDIELNLQNIHLTDVVGFLKGVTNIQVLQRSGGESSRMREITIEKLSPHTTTQITRSRPIQGGELHAVNPKSLLWEFDKLSREGSLNIIENLRLTIAKPKNMRLGSTDPENVQFAEFLVEVGHNPKENVELPSSLHRCVDLNHLISEIYPGIREHKIPSAQYLTERTIRSTRNEDVAKVNERILQMYRGKEYTYLEADKVAETKVKGAVGFSGCPTESLNTLNQSFLPPFKLELKVGCPIMMPRNIAPKDGPCNGTRFFL